jgi:hypothetical protein
MKTFVLLSFLATATAAVAADPIKFISPDKTSTLLVDKSGKRDLIELKSGKTVHRLFYDDLDALFKPKLAKAFDASLNKVGKIVLPTFISARWISADDVEIKGESSVIINDDAGDQFNFTATVSKAGTIKDVAVIPKR